MIYDYFRWLNFPLISRYKVEPIERIQKEFNLEKQEQQKKDQEEKPEAKEKLEHKKGSRLSIWV